MTEGMIIDIFTEAIRVILMLSAPMLLSGLLIGLLIAIFQATTQIQEATLAFVPKIVVVFLVLVLTGSWIINSLLKFSLSMFDIIDKIIY